MNIDLEYASKLTQRVVSIDGIAHLQTMLDADVVDDVALGVNALQVPIEIDDVMQEARLRACRYAQGVSTVYSTIDPVPGGSVFSDGRNSLKLPAGETDLSNLSGGTLRQVATRCLLPVSYQSGAWYHEQRIPHIACADLTAPLIVKPAFRLSNTSGEVALGAAPTVQAMVIEYNGVVTPVKFNGATSFDVPNGGMVTSDPVDLPAPIPSGAKFYVYSLTSFPSGYPYKSITDFSTADGPKIAVSATALTSHASNPSEMTGGSWVEWPTAAILDVSELNSWFVAGDSRIAGMDGEGNLSYAFERTPAIFAAVASESLSGVLTAGRYTNRAILAGYCQRVACNLGINDIWGGASAATVKTRIADYITLIANKPIWWCTMEGRTTSTDLWATVASQTLANSTYETVRQAVNSWIRQRQSKLSGYFEIAGVLEGAQGLWKGAERVVADAGITSGANVVSSSTALFRCTDEGKKVLIPGAGAAGVTLVAKITEVTSASTAKLESNAGTTVSGATCYVGVVCFDGVHGTDYASRLVAASGAVNPSSVP